MYIWNRFCFLQFGTLLGVVGSCLCPSLNIFGLKTGSLGWRKDTNRIYIFTTCQSGGLRLAGGGGELVRHLQLSCRTKHPQLSNIPPPPFLRILFCMKMERNHCCQAHIASPKNFSAFPAFAAPSPPSPPRAPWRAPIMHAADRFKQQVGLPALK